MREPDKQNAFHECCYCKMSLVSFCSFNFFSLDIDTIVYMKKKNPDISFYGMGI